jgi:hypothetical protein
MTGDEIDAVLTAAVAAVPQQYPGQRRDALGRHLTVHADPDRGAEVYSIYLCGEWVASALTQRMAEQIRRQWLDNYWLSQTGLF